ncbi:MAG TPA: phosphatase PAP2 family protein [Phycisphaerales bacterium]|nr:phosphatase PAP2 family protein [Phycisphaerales bacterium]
MRTAIDYNRGLRRPVRALHVGAAVARDAMAPVTRPDRRGWLLPLLAGLLVTALVLPMDEAIWRWVRTLPLGGDVRRELEAWQQYGALGSLVFVTLVMWLLDAPRRRRLADLWLAAGLVSLSCVTVKVLVGRPRPLLGDAWTFLGPAGVYPLADEAGAVTLRHAWEPGVKSALWSFPSSHTAAAVVLSVFLATMYPRLRWVAVGMAVLVGSARVVLGDSGAHWPSDVVAGATLGFVIARPVVARGLGARLAEAVMAARDRRAERRGGSRA